MTATAVQVALILFVGMGPIKVLVYYLAAIHDAEPAVARRVAVMAVLTATVTAFGLLIVGALLMRLLHFSSAALIVGGGIILVAYAIVLVLSTTPGHQVGPPHTEAMLMRLAVYPMGVPLILNPAGIAAATIFSAEADDPAELAFLAAVILAIAAVDLVVLFIARPIGPRLPRDATLVLEQLLGVLLAAVAIELIMIGLDQYGVITLPA